MNWKTEKWKAVTSGLYHLGVNVALPTGDRIRYRFFFSTFCPYHHVNLKHFLSLGIFPLRPYKYNLIEFLCSCNKGRQSAISGGEWMDWP